MFYSDLRFQFQKLIRQSYLLQKMSENRHISEETQTNETFVNFEKATTEHQV